MAYNYIRFEIIWLLSSVWCSVYELFHYSTNWIAFGLIAFGSSAVEYPSLIDAILFLLKMFLEGKSSHYQLLITSEISSLAQFSSSCIWLSLAVFLLLNVFIAILDKYYTASKKQQGKIWIELRTLKFCFTHALRPPCAIYVTSFSSLRKRRKSLLEQPLQREACYRFHQTKIF